jgi:hypothetical protein
MTEDNSHAGQGAVLLDIGDDIGALVVRMPSELLGEEIEIRPRGAAPHSHDHAHDHAHDHPHFPHVAVVNRPSDGRAGAPVASAVFGELDEGEYELYVRPDGPVRLTATIGGGEVTYATWA